MRDALAPADVNDRATALENESHSTKERRVLKPYVVECLCGARLRLAMEWTAFKCGKCGEVTEL